MMRKQKKLFCSLVILLVSSVAMVIALAACRPTPHEVVTLTLTWEEQEWTRDIAFYEPCEESVSIVVGADYSNSLNRGGCGHFRAVYECECIEGKRRCGPPVGAIDFDGRGDCFEVPLPYVGFPSEEAHPY
jgi:hypothetical protein